jgi:putative membrane protein
VLTTGALVGHLAPPVAPDDIWRAWSWDVAVWLTLLGALVVHRRGSRTAGATGYERWRRWAFVAAIVTTGVALVSPLDALSGSLASAHMVQHLLLTVVVAPLLVLSAPTAALLRGLPRFLRFELHQLHRTRVHPARFARAHPVPLAVVHAATLWFWHASAPYELALRNDLVHRVEHLMFLLTALASWVALVPLLRHRQPFQLGVPVLVLFALSVQSSILGALLTFSRAPWYSSYGDRSVVWGLTPLGDQQLAGSIMWVPGGVTYLAAALAAIIVWITQTSPRPAAAAQGRSVGS